MSSTHETQAIKYHQLPLSNNSVIKAKSCMSETFNCTHQLNFRHSPCWLNHSQRQLTTPHSLRPPQFQLKAWMQRVTRVTKRKQSSRVSHFMITFSLYAHNGRTHILIDLCVHHLGFVWGACEYRFVPDQNHPQMDHALSVVHMKVERDTHAGQTSGNGTSAIHMSSMCNWCGQYVLG